MFWYIFFKHIFWLVAANMPYLDRVNGCLGTAVCTHHYKMMSEFNCFDSKNPQKNKTLDFPYANYITMSSDMLPVALTGFKKKNPLKNIVQLTARNRIKYILKKLLSNFTHEDSALLNLYLNCYLAFKTLYYPSNVYTSLDERTHWGL